MKDDNEIFHRIIDEITSDLDGMPIEIDRGDKENLVLVSAATYHGLIQKIYALEHAVMTDDEREAGKPRAETAMSALIGGLTKNLLFMRGSVTSFSHERN